MNVVRGDKFEQRVGNIDICIFPYKFLGFYLLINRSLNNILDFIQDFC